MDGQQNPLMQMMSLMSLLGAPQQKSGGTPTAPRKAHIAEPKPQIDPKGLLNEIFANSGQEMKMGGSVGSVMPTPTGQQPDMGKYGQGGERMFYGQNGAGGATPISATPGLGVGAPAPPVTGQAPQPGSQPGGGGGQALQQVMRQLFSAGRG